MHHHIDTIVVQQQVELASSQLSESRKSIQQADTIKRLTILAFIYIPIQTAAGIFGMNISELRRELPIWTFVVLAIGLLLATLAAAVLSSKIVRRIGPAIERRRRMRHLLS